MGRKSDTGDPTPYDDADEAALEAAIDAAWYDYDGGDQLGAGGEPTRVTGRAQIEWSGSVDRANGGVRNVNFGNLKLGPVRKALKESRAARQAVRDARPSSSRAAKGWHAQLRELTSTKYGSTAADRAGLNPSARTLRNWLSEANAPSKANQQRIGEAYAALRNRQVDQATDRAVTARHNLAQTVSHSFRQEFNVEIRLRDIERLDLE